MTERPAEGVGRGAGNLKMELFPYVMECLKEFNYPCVHSMDDAKVFEVFLRDNRQFLVSWFLKQLDEEFEEIVENASKKELGDILYAQGLCSRSEKDDFMNAACNEAKQMTILATMFKFLKNISQSSITEIKNVDINSSLYIDTNLFPSYGSLKVLDLNEQNKKIKEINDEITTLTELIKQLNPIENKCEFDEALKMKLSNNLNNLTTQLVNFKHNVYEVLNKNNKKSANILLNENFTSTVELHSNELTSIHEAISYINNIMRLDTKMEKLLRYNMDYNIMLRELAEVCHEISLLKKEH